MILILKNVYCNLDDIVNKYNNTYRKVKPVDVKSSTYIEFYKKNNKEDPQFKVGDHVSHQFCLQKVLSLKKKLKILYRGHMLLVITISKTC